MKYEGLEIKMMRVKFAASGNPERPRERERKDVGRMIQTLQVWRELSKHQMALKNIQSFCLLYSTPANRPTQTHVR